MKETASEHFAISVVFPSSTCSSRGEELCVEHGAILFSTLFIGQHIRRLYVCIYYKKYVDTYEWWWCALFKKGANTSRRVVCNNLNKTCVVIYVHARCSPVHTYVHSPLFYTEVSIVL